MGDDRNFFTGFLLLAIDDNCIELPKGWMDLPIDVLRSKCAEAHVNAAVRILNGETLPSELRPIPTGGLQ